MSGRVKWLVQEQGFAMANRADAIETLARLGFAYESFGVAPHSSRILNLESILHDPEERFVVRGGTRIYALLKAAGDIAELCDQLSQRQLGDAQKYLDQLRRGIFYDEQKFDQAYYSGLGLPLLNSDATLYLIAEHLGRSFGQEMFIKPSKDEKAFDAGILAPGQTIEAFIRDQPHARRWQDEVAVVAPRKAIIAEYRFFVVRQQVVTGSLYRLAGKPLFEASIPNSVMQAATDFARLYQPHAIFTMDLAETPDGIRIVEYNCWNASRTYAADMAKIFGAVQDHVACEPWPPGGTPQSINPC